MGKARLSVHPLNVGAEISGLAKGDENDPAIKAALYDAWLTHGILLFRNVDTPEWHLALSRCFGDLELHPIEDVRLPENPLFIVLGGNRRGPAFVYDGTDLRINRIAWHRDTAYTVDICKGAMLRMLEVPAVGGETMLCDTARAYDDLPQDVKTRLEGMEYKATLRLGPIEQTRPGAFWKTVRQATKEEDPAGGSWHVDQKAVDAKYSAVVHPVVLTHPESGRKCIFLSPTYVDAFLGLPKSESDELHRYLVDHMLQPKYIYTHHWSVNDAILWDNRRFMHAALGNTPDLRRYGLRTTLAGPTRTGRYYDEKAAAPEMVAD